MAENKDKILYNVKRVELTELDPSTWDAKEKGTKVVVKCDSEVTIEPEVNQGNQVVLRDETRIYAEAKEEDLLTALKVTLTTVKVNEQAVAMVQGGEVVYSEEVGHTEEIIGYNMPTQAELATQKKYFSMDLYVANYEGADIVDYTKFNFPKCRGNGVIPFNFNKSNFFSPAFPILAKEITSKDKPCMGWVYVDKLPTDTAVTNPTT